MLEHQVWRVQAVCLSVTVALIALFPTGVSARAPRADSAEKSDVIIVGAGLAGLSAALEAGRAGEKMIVIDEASVFGGHAIMSEGELNVIDSPLQISKGIKDSPDLAYADFTKWGEDNDPGWVRYCVEHSKVEIFDWVTAMGVGFHGINAHEGSSVPRIHLTDGRGLAANARHAIPEWASPQPQNTLSIR
jgi:predicted oxidoreductase